MAEGFRTFDHTGDLGLEVWAETPERLFALAAEALLAQVVECPPGEPEVRIDIGLEGDDAGDLLVHWLNTALLEAELREAVWTRARVERLTPRSVTASLEGPRRDPARQTFLREVKAVSHHFLQLELEPPRCRCRLVLDI
jgi:SHS2 domain-containing protein